MLLIAVSAPPVFSAHAEVVPSILPGSSESTRILRARGGSSTPYYTRPATQRYSPRTRR